MAKKSTTQLLGQKSILILLIILAIVLAYLIVKPFIIKFSIICTVSFVLCGNLIIRKDKYKCLFFTFFYHGN